MTSRGKIDAERGQALAQVAISLVVLLAFVALAVDTGNVYAERRRMQNAADAGALAGARELCLTHPVNDAISAAREYMALNGVDPAEIESGDVTVVGNVVNVIARKTAGTFFAGIIGFGTVDIAAEAAAACGNATTACGLWPIAFEEELWDSDDIECGEEFVIWNAENENQALVCDANGDGELDNICDCYDCDPDGDDVDFVVLTSTSRGWLDFSDVEDAIFTDDCQAEGCGAAELVCRIRADSSAQISLPTCIPGIRGVKAGTKDDIDYRTGDAVSIAIYDQDASPCEADSNCSGTEADTFWVTQFGCVVVQGWEQQFVLEPLAKFSDTLKTERSKSIVVERDDCGETSRCTTSCGSTDGSAPIPGGLSAVSLIK